MKPFSRVDETVLKQGLRTMSSKRQGTATMQFIFDLIWTQSRRRYLASIGKQEARQ